MADLTRLVFEPSRSGKNGRLVVETTAGVILVWKNGNAVHTWWMDFPYRGTDDRPGRVRIRNGAKEVVEGLWWFLLEEESWES